MAGYGYGRRSPPPEPDPERGCISIEGLSFRVCPTSWWRSVHHNAEIGGAADSNHLTGCAIDWTTDPPGHEHELHRWATRTLKGAWIEPWSESHTHVHVDWRCAERS